MLNTLSARTTFYDIIGYFVPGALSLGIVWLWLVILGGGVISDMLVEAMLKHWVAASVFLAALSYVAGHCANSCSSWLLEKHVFASAFKIAADWFKRVHEESPEREAVIAKHADSEFHLVPNELKSFDLLIRMEEFFPQSTISGFSFLCFYGMCRTLALLAWFSSIPVGIYIGIKWDGTILTMVAAGVVSGVFICLVGALFINQYLRFVQYYYDFLGSTLMFSRK